MVHKTKGIILRTVKYGETSLIISIFTELFGLQSYIANGVRSVSKKGTAKASYFQPAALLDLVVYHNDLKNLQRIKEHKWCILYQHIYSDIFKNAVSLFIVELLNKCLKEPEPQPELFYFAEDALMHLDEADKTTTANFPIFFAVNLASFFGFRIQDEFSEVRKYLDLQEGFFTSSQPQHPHFLEGKEAEAIAEIMKVVNPHEMTEIKLNQETRRNILHALENFYALHIPNFGSMKTTPILKEITS